MEISRVNFIHLLDLTKRTYEKLNYTGRNRCIFQETPLGGIEPAALQCDSNKCRGAEALQMWGADADQKAHLSQQTL
jgi:hypothetical protein